MPHITRLLAALALLISTAVAAQAQGAYRVQPGDTLTIEVLEDSSLNRSLVVLPDGGFNFPFAGALAAGGRTAGQIQNAIASAIASNFADTPTVFVTVQPRERPASTGKATAKTIDIYFLGEVNTPGLREVAPGTTFLQAMAQSGGLTRFAATKRIQLRRTSSTGQQSLQSFNYKALSEGKVLEQDPKLRDGDIILVPQRRLFE